MSYETNKKDKMSCHILPIDDLEEHEETTTCKCEPRLEIINGEMLIIHNSFDQREVIEEVNEILNEEAK